MKNDEKKSIVKEALTDYEKIMEAADVNAKKKLAEEMPEKFNEILKEELNKDKKSKTKKGEEDVIITESKKDEEMKKDKVEKTKKEDIKESVEEIKEETISEDIDSDNVVVQPEDDGIEGDEITMDQIENEIANMEEMNGEMNELFGGGIKDKIANLNPEDSQAIEDLFYKVGNFKNKMIQQGAVKLAAKKTPTAKKYQILQQYAEDGGTIALDKDGTVTYQTKEQMGQRTGSEFAGGGTKGKMAAGGVVGEQDDMINELFNMGLKSKINSLQPQDTETIELLFSKVPNFKNKMIQQGAVKLAVAKTPTEKKYEILKQYAEDGGTIALDKDGTATYQSKELMGQKTGSQFAGGGTQGKMAAGGVVGEAKEDMPFDEKKTKIVTDLSNQEDQPYDEMVKMRNKLDEMIKTMDESKKVCEEDTNEGEEMITDEDLDAVMESVNEEAVTEESVNEEAVTEESVNEETVTEEVVNEENIEEMHGVDYAKRRNMTSRGHNPQPEYLSSIEKDQSPEQFQESKAKIDSLIQENKKLTKKLNELTKEKKNLTESLDQYKDVMGRYRNQLKEMAVFNSNLANVNNLLVNEELALTQEDKVKVIGDFKNIKTIAESKEKYQNVLSDMKESKKTISENVEEKVVTSIQPSSKQKLDEVVEKTAYANDNHLARMKKLMTYGDKK